MYGGSLETSLAQAGQIFHWKRWSTGVEERGLYYIEYETSEQYDEWLFDSKSEFDMFIANLVNRLKID